ncbi:MAG TPA: Panacea domain-containing protein [Bacteroidota bacterium]|nr:Panacea domain-containing protein [Bacteroidota bacterium]
MESQNKYRKKLLEAMVYFASALKNPTKMMMYKVLAEFDFRHIEQTGLPVTNLEYEAWEMGPVPRELHNEITKGKELVLPDDFQKSLYADKEEFIDKVTGETKSKFIFHNKRKADLSVFSPRQVKILEQIAEIYKYTTATNASKASHEYDKPWARTVKKKGEGAIIDYTDQITDKTPLNKEEAEEWRRESLAFKKNMNG